MSREYVFAWFHQRTNQNRLSWSTQIKAACAVKNKDSLFIKSMRNCCQARWTFYKTLRSCCGRKKSGFSSLWRDSSFARVGTRFSFLAASIISLWWTGLKMLVYAWTSEYMDVAAEFEITTGGLETVVYLCFIIIFIYFFQYVRERSLYYFNF